MRRFDMVAIVLDKPDPVADEKLANHVVDVHMHSHHDCVRFLTDPC